MSKLAAPQTAPASRLHSLDGLRGIAALVVFVHHSFLVVPDLASPYYGGETTDLPWLTYSPLHILWAGSEAVYVFFVLSGLVLTFSVIRGGSFNWKAYYPSRLVRLYLPVAASLVLALIAALLVSRAAEPGQSDWLERHDQTVSVSTILRDMLLVTGTSTLNGPLWSLRWEVLFSLLLPLYVWLCMKLKRVWPVLTLGLLLTLVGSQTVLPNSVGFMAIFAAGAILAVKWEHINRIGDRIEASGSSGLWWLALLTLSVIGLTLRWTYDGLTGDPAPAFTFPVGIVSATAIVFVASQWPAASRVLCRPIIAWFGQISFSLYLVHEPIIVAAAHLLPSQTPWLVLFVAGPVSIALAWAFYVAVERPSHKISSTVRRRLTPTPEREREGSKVAAA